MLTSAEILRSAVKAFRGRLSESPRCTRQAAEAEPRPLGRHLAAARPALSRKPPGISPAAAWNFAGAPVHSPTRQLVEERGIPSPLEFEFPSDKKGDL